MTRFEVLRFIRKSSVCDQPKTIRNCRIMGHDLSDFAPEEQVEILLWALEDEQKRSADYLRGWRMSQEAKRIRREGLEASAG